MSEQDQFTPRPEYPRPQFVREDWSNLNGVWEFAFDDANHGVEQGWARRQEPFDGEILVPFPFQSRRSGICDSGFHDVLWYAREFEIPEPYRGREIALRFGAVDYETTAWVNGCQVGSNRGGHVPFTFNVTPFIRPGPNRLVLRVVDTQDPTQPRGKQFWRLRPEGCYYTRTSGIWQTVWLEPLAPRRIDSLRITPDVDQGAVRLLVRLCRPAPSDSLAIRISRLGYPVSGLTVRGLRGEIDVELELGKADLWSPERPNLYDLELELLDGDGRLDRVTSYFGMRKISVAGQRVLLNNQPYFQRLVLDQGYHPEGVLAAPGDDALRADVEWVKRFGFNGVRKHQKIEDPRFLYWCDRLGLLVWGEMANAREYGLAAEDALADEWSRVLRRDYNHPCIVVWVPFNESWGVPALRHDPLQRALVRRVVGLTRSLDPTRLVVDNDGWEHTGETDLCTIHDYTADGDRFHARYAGTGAGARYPAAWDRFPIYLDDGTADGKPLLFTEVGGYLAEPAGVPDAERDALYDCYGSVRSGQELLERYRGLMQGIARLPHSAGFCYTQLTDVEQELNGLLTADRRPKVDPRAVASVHRRLFASGRR
jgi:beta-galactosidase/beta-glucuronidase